VLKIREMIISTRFFPARAAVLLLSAALLAGCGAAKTARQTGQMFDKYGCLAKELKGEPPCPPPA
jgi:hypothetical protein